MLKANLTNNRNNVDDLLITPKLKCRAEILAEFDHAGTFPGKNCYDANFNHSPISKIKIGRRTMAQKNSARAMRSQ